MDNEGARAAPANSPPMALPPDRAHRTGAFWLDFLVATSAVIISVISLWVAQRSDGTQERLLAASVWPYVEFFTSNLPEGKPEIELTLRNAGVGPARIRWMTVDYRGKSVIGPRALLTACCESSRSRVLQYVTSTVTHTVLVPHESVNFLAVTPSARNVAQYKTLDRERSNLHVRVCYCSVLDDCWLLDNHSEEDPQPVGKCPPIPSDDFDA